MFHVTLYFPSLTRHGVPIADRDTLLHATAIALVAEFGGMTRTQGTGGYKSNAGDYVFESVDMFETWAPDLAVVRSIAARLLTELDQESVLLKIDGKPEFLTAMPQVAAG